MTNTNILYDDDISHKLAGIRLLPYCYEVIQTEAYRHLISNTGLTTSYIRYAKAFQNTADNSRFWEQFGSMPCVVKSN